MAWPFPLPEPSRSVQCFLYLCGHSLIAGEPYDLDGQRCGNTSFSVVQWTVRGHGRLRHETREYDVGPGQAFLLNSSDDYRYWHPAGSEPWEFVFLSLMGVQASGIMREIIQRHGPVMDLSAKSAPVRLLGNILRKAERNKVATMRQASALGYEFLMALMDEAFQRQSLPRFPEAVNRGLEFCEQNYMRPIGAIDMARAAGVSRAHFTRLFRRATGSSPIDHLIWLRLNHASRLLTENLPIKEIAMRCGIADVNYFCRLFRRRTGTSPGQWRKSAIM